MGRLFELHQRATTRRARRPPMALTRPIGSASVIAPLSVVAVALIGVLWAVETWLLSGPTRALDAELITVAAEQRTAANLVFARAVTHLGDLWVVAVIGAVLVVLARRRAGRWDSAILAGVVVGGALIITAISKDLTGRVRPAESFTSTVSLAFPSGHAARAAAVYALIAWLAIRWSKHPATRHVLTVLAVAMALLTGWSRVVLGAHWPTDVFAGWALGLIWFGAVLVVLRPQPVDGTRRTEQLEGAEDAVVAGRRS